MKIKVILFLTVIFSFYIGVIENFAQSQFQIAINDTNPVMCWSMIQTSDEGYALAGSIRTWGPDSSDTYIVKLDAGRNIQWTKIIEVINHDFAYSIIQTADGGYAITGNVFTTGGWATADIFIVKLDANGTMQWYRTVGGAGYDDSRSIIQTADEGFAVTGCTNSFGTGYYDLYILKLDRNGTLQWYKTVGGTNYEEGNSIIQTKDGGYAVSGTTSSFGAGEDDMFLVKLNSNGILQWTRTVGGTYNDDGYSIIQTKDGGYAVAGTSDSIGTGPRDMYIVKFDNNGTLQWTRILGGQIDVGVWDIIQNTNGEYLVAGSGGDSFGGMYIVKFDTGGFMKWNRTIGTYDGDYAASIIQATDGGYITAGRSDSSSFSIIKLDSNGFTCGNFSTPSSQSGTRGATTSPTPTVITYTPTVLSPTPNVRNGDATLTTICIIGIQPISNEVPASYKLFQNYPNPFNPSTKIKFTIPLSKGGKGDVSLKIYDILGRVVATLINEKLKAGEYELSWNGSDYPSGIYFYKLQTEYYSESKKMLLIK